MCDANFHLPPRLFSVYSELGRVSHVSGFYSKSNANLARDLGCSLRTATSALKELSEAGWIIRVARRYNQPSRWQIVTHAEWTSFHSSDACREAVTAAAALPRQSTTFKPTAADLTADPFDGLEFPDDDNPAGWYACFNRVDRITAAAANPEEVDATWYEAHARYKAAVERNDPAVRACLDELARIDKEPSTLGYPVGAARSAWKARRDDADEKVKQAARKLWARVYQNRPSQKTLSAADRIAASLAR